MRIADFSVLGILAALGCGPQPAPETPFIVTDVASIGFGTEFATATPVGTSPTQPINVTNRGQSDLSITEVTQAGDSAFFVQLEGQTCRALPPQNPDCDPMSSVLPTKVKGLQSTFIRLFFTPPRVGVYRGTLNIKSNAENTKDLEIRLCGVGIKKSTDGGENEVPDAGFCER